MPNLRVLLFIWLLASALLTGCASAPYSFRLNQSRDAGKQWLLPPGTTREPDKLTLLVEASFLDRCPVSLPRLSSDSIEVDAPNWDAVHKRVLRVELSPVLAHHAPAAACLNTAIREPKNCYQKELAASIKQMLASDSLWATCLPNDTDVLASELRDSLPLEPKYTSAIAGLATYDAQSNLEFVRLMPGSAVCISRDYASYDDPQAWLSVGQSCKRLLSAGVGGGVTFDRQDEARHFGFADRFKDSSRPAVYEARSWTTVRAAAAAVFDGRFHAYIHFPQTLKYDKIPLKLSSPSKNSDYSLRFYPGPDDADEDNKPVPVGPVLVLRRRDEPLADLAQDPASPKLNDLCLTGRCFFAPDEGVMDVLLPVQINGRPQMMALGALPTDWPELASARTITGYRRFHGRPALLDFDLTDILQAIPVTADDVFWSSPR